uniref:Uncharacterized protein n=1 Tax=Globodera rostochiensis TaxID=31243 RepID=A0A914H1G8_GLORO
MKKSSSRLRTSLKRVPSNSAKFFDGQQKLLGRRTHPLGAKLPISRQIYCWARPPGFVGPIAVRRIGPLFGRRLFRQKKQVQVSSLQDAFDSLAEPIDGLETEARLMAALSQLEHIGVVKSVTKMSTNSATTASTDNEISLLETADVRADDGVVDDRLTISSLSSSLVSSTATTDTEDGGDGVVEGRKRKKKGVDGSSGRAGSVKDVEEMDGEGLLLAEAAASGSDKDNDALCETKTRNQAIARLITFSCILFTVPLTLMYLTYRFLFIGHFHLAHDRAILYAGIVAAATVYLILAVFAWVAYRDESELANQMTASAVMEEIIPNLRDPLVKSRMKSLFAYSFLILFVPLGSMFLLKNFLFETLLGYQKRDSMLYSAIAAVVLVHVVLIIWIRTAWDEGKPAEKTD